MEGLTVKELIKIKEDELNSLKHPKEGFKVMSFKLWSKPSGIPLMEWQFPTFSWGHCRSETCFHNSHDPYCEGGTAFVECKALGNNRYELKDGKVVLYTARGNRNGRHFSNIYSLEYI